MSEYMVDVGLNLQADNYITTMGQAINLTKQYANVAEGVPGTVQNMSKSLVGATMAVTGFNKINGVALDTAAAYEKQLSQIEATTKISGQSFEKLAKTTKGWAREFPIGMNQAVEVMQTLQMQGIKSEKQMTDLGKSFIKLGAATGTRPGALGEQMLQLTRTMGNSTNQFEKLSDSLITTTNKLGGNAPAVVAFSKALAPVAATVGISQTAVTGLSAAMSRLGEDGFQAANSFNKVMLDMNRAIRDGGPELKAYADLLGTTSDRLRTMFKENPTEVLAQFSEAVGKSGPNVSRTLDALGFDSVRTARSLTALSRSGSLREAIDTSVGAYGDGSTAKAAATAMEGLTDSAAKLQETMSQTVANVGAPVLGLARGMLAPAQAVAGAAQAVTGSQLGQQFFGATGAISTAAGMVGSIIPIATVAALGKMALDFVKKQPGFENMRTGFREGRSPTTAGPSGMSRMSGLGYAAGSMLTGSRGLTDTPGSGAGAVARMAGRGMEALSRYQWAAGNMLRTLPGAGFGAGLSGVTPVMQGLRDDMRGSIASMRDSAKNLDGRGFGTATRGLMGQAALYARTADVGPMTGAKNLAMASGTLAARATMGTVGMGAAGLAAAGRGLGAMGLNPAMLGILGAAGGGMYLYSKNKESSQRSEDILDFKSDVYARFNDFAEATGKASKGVVGFQEKIENTTKTLVEANSSMRDAIKLDSAEISNANSPGYKPQGLAFYGDDRSAEALTFAVQSTLGTNPSVSDVAAIQQDVAYYAKGNLNTIRQVEKNLEGIYGESANVEQAVVDASAFLNTLNNNSGAFDFGTNEVQADLAKNWLGAVGMATSELQRVYGDKQTITTADGRELGFQQVASALAGRDLYETNAAMPTMEDSAYRTLQTALTGAFGLEEVQGNTDFDTSFLSDAKRQGFRGESGEDGERGAAKSFDQLLADNPALKDIFDAIDAAGITQEDGIPNYGSAFQRMPSESQSTAETYFSNVTRLSGASESFGEVIEGLSGALFGLENAAIKTGKSFDDLNQSDILAVGGNAALADYARDSGDIRKETAAVESVTKDIYQSTKSFSESAFALQLAISESDSTGPQRAVFERSLDQLDIRKGVVQAGRSGVLSMLDQVELGRQANRTPATSSNQQVITATVNQGMQAQGALLSQFADVNRAFGALQANIRATQRSAGVQINSIARNARIGEERAREDFDTQQQYARQDYRTTRRRARRDFGIQTGRAERDFGRQQARAEEDYNIARERAARDFNISMERADRDFNLQKTRMAEDFNKSRARAERDFNKEMTRSVRDFNLGQGRAQEDFDRNQLRSIYDFNKSKMRAQEDFNKQMTRASEDAAKQMYDPFKRIQAQMVMDAGQLVANLGDQTRMMEQQTANLSKARDLGLSDVAIRQLNLADSSNAQQLSRLVGDLSGNEDLAGQINEMVAAKDAAAKALYEDSGNTQRTRALEDFATQLGRMEEDFNTATARSEEDFALQRARSMTDFSTQLSDAQADFSQSMADGMEDYNLQLARANADYVTQTNDARADFERQINDMATDFARNKARSLEDFMISMNDMREDFSRQMNDMERDYYRSRERAAEALTLAIARMREDAKNAIADVGASVGASIAAMEESFFGFMQNSPEGLAAAQQFVDMVTSSKIDVKNMSDDFQAMYKAAQALINGSMATVLTSDRVGMDAFKEFKGVDDKPSAGYDESDKLSMKDGSVAQKAMESYKKIGEAAAEGFIGGIKDYVETWWDGLWQGFVDSLKARYGIASPSRVFEEIGRNVIDGFVDGIETIPAKLWDKLTDTLPSAAALDRNVRAAFANAKEWLKSFVSEDSPLTEWIGKGWEKLFGGLPTPVEALEELLKVFTGENSVKSWLNNLGTWIGENIPSVGDIVSSLSNVTEGFRQTFSNIFELWNDLNFSPKFDVAKQTGLGAFDFGGWTVGGKEILPKARFGGVTMPGFTLNFPDLVPNVPNPFKATGKTNNRALGGIVTQPEKAWLAEAGYPEAVIPLNARGAEVLAATMARYVDKTDIQASGMERYASPVTNYYSNTQDYSTQFNGEITVQAANPDELAHKLQARARRQALAQPIRGQR
jgi:TP901 family phage tail tape measure protein